MSLGCPFCERAADPAPPHRNASVASFADAFPLSTGHTLVVPIAHVPDLFELPEADYAALWALVRRVRDDLRERHAPAGFNIGVNAGEAAGQTVAHAHVHVIPRYAGDVADPRGGVRWVLPDRAAYWKRDD